MKADSISIPCIPALEASAAAIRRVGRQSNVSAARQVLLIMRKEFGDRFRSGWVIACVLVWLGAIGLTSFLGLLQIGRIGVQGYERTVISMLNVVQYLVPLLGLLLGHDLIVSENEERTLRLIMAGGVSRARLVVGKFFGGCLTMMVPLLLGFVIAGTVIGVAAKDAGIIPFVRLAASGLLLGVIFLSIGLALSTLCRTRVQALVAGLLTWCLAVFVFDLVALGVLVSTKAPAAAQEIEIVCDATHVNAAVDLHSDFDTAPNSTVKPAGNAVGPSSSLAWLMVNPVDLFRTVNLSQQLGLRVSPARTFAVVTLWLTAMLGISLLKFRRTDL
jgi:Cu-processing system permease protein